MARAALPRVHVLVALLAASGAAACEVCQDTQVRDSAWYATGLVAGGDRAMAAVVGNRAGEAGVVTWTTIAADGTTAAAGELPVYSALVDRVPGTTIVYRWHDVVAGSATVMWVGQAETGQREAVLARFDGREPPRAFPIVDGPIDAFTATFDGTRYRMFWETGRTVVGRSLSEDGALGPVWSFMPLNGGAALSALSDGAGRTFLRVSYAPHETGLYAIDTFMPGARRIWSTPELPCTSPRTDLWFAGELRVAGCAPGPVVFAVDPDSGAARTDPLPAALDRLSVLRARGDTLFAVAGTALLALAPDYTVTASFGSTRTDQPIPDLLGDAVVRVETDLAGVAVSASGASGDERWRHPIAVGSEPTTVETCRPAGY